MYKDKYQEEEAKEREAVEAEVNAKKKAIRDTFLNDFYLPLRRKYEKDIPKYMELWSLKDDALAEEQAPDWGGAEEGPVRAVGSLCPRSVRGTP